MQLLLQLLLRPELLLQEPRLLLRMCQLHPLHLQLPRAPLLPLPLLHLPPLLLLLARLLLLLLGLLGLPLAGGLPLYLLQHLLPGWKLLHGRWARACCGWGWAWAWAWALAGGGCGCG